jgi:hypothetical protein
MKRVILMVGFACLPAFGCGDDDNDGSATDADTDSDTDGDTDSDTDTDTDADTDTDTDTDTDADTDSDADADTDGDTDTDTDTDTDSDTDTDTDGDTDTDSDTDADTDGDTDTYTNPCPDGEHAACYGNDVWCLNSEDMPQSLQETCTDGEQCVAVTTEVADCQCVGDWYQGCYAGDVWAYDSCDQFDHIVDMCVGDEECVMLDALTAACCVAEAKQQCGEDGNVHWYDSCDVEGEVAYACGGSLCENTSETTAKCKTTLCSGDGDCASMEMICNENWGVCAVSTCAGELDFTPCEVVTSPDRSFDICVGEVCVSPGCGDETCNTPGPHFPLADTGHRSCFNATTTMTCTSFPCSVDGTPAFCGQDAQYGWDAVLGNDPEDRFDRDLSVADQPVVVDNVTGLVWQGCAYGRTGDTCTGGTATSAVWETQVANCDSLGWGGFTDWRLPDRFELQSIIDYSRSSSPMIDVNAFPNTPGLYFWSSTSRPDLTSNAWTFTFYGGGTTSYHKTYENLARCVRSGSLEPRYLEPSTLSGYRVVKDTLEGLMWQGCALGQTAESCAGTATAMTWQEALKYCEALSWGGETDWRLPNIDELATIVDNHKTTEPSIDTDAFPNTPSDWYWSSTTRPYDVSDAWLVVFNSGFVYLNCKTDSFPVRCVRDDPGTDADVDTDSDADTDSDTDTESSNPGEQCYPSGQCTGEAICAKAFVEEITSYCYLDCEGDETLCDDSGYPYCVDLGDDTLCLKDVALSADSFTCEVGGFHSGNSVPLRIGDEAPVDLTHCNVGYQSSTDEYYMQLSALVGVYQRDVILFWPAASHVVGTITTATGTAQDVDYSPDEKWLLGVFQSGQGTVTLTEAGTTTGSIVAGSLDFAGWAYTAELVP